MSGDNTTSAIEWIVLGTLLVVGAVFFVKPATASVGIVVDFIDAFPSPSALGPYGSLVAAIAMAFGGGGLARKKL